MDCGERSDFLYFEVDDEVSFKYRTVLGGPQWDSGRLPKWYAFHLGLASGSPSGKVHKIEQITIY